MSIYYIALEQWGDGTVCSCGSDVTRSLWDVAAHLARGEDDGRTFCVISAEYRRNGARAFTMDVTEDVAKALADHYRSLDHPEGIPANERPWVHPLAVDRGGFEWNDNEWERKDGDRAADDWRDMREGR